MQSRSDASVAEEKLRKPRSAVLLEEHKLRADVDCVIADSFS